MPDRIRNKDNYYDKLYALMEVLREECPWDKEQTLLSLRRYTLEEVHEVLEAVDLADTADNWQPLKSELGDLLIQVLFYARIAEEAEKFNLADVIEGLIDKMIYRHPHVFDQANPDNLTDQWNELKSAEHGDRRKSLMDDIPPLPALKYAQKQQQRAAQVAFDWNNASDVMVKMREELDELENEVTHGDLKQIENEFGDVLFTLTNLARKLGLDAELCLMSSNRKFAERFRMMERLAEQRGVTLDVLDIDQKERLYNEVKELKN